jgi:predicted lipoprotein with Yx(FWY)xxD motif
MKLVHFAAMMIVALIVLAACAPAPVPTPVPPAATAVPPATKAPASSSAASSAPASSSAASSAPASSAASSAMKPAALMVTNNATFGKIVTDADGMSLYMYTKDTRDPSVSNCYDACAQRWPPLLADANGKFDLKGNELDAKMFGTTTRKEGTKQVTFNGWPLYYWQNDKKAGDTLGQGVGDVWWVMTPDSTIITGPSTVALTFPVGAGRDGDQSGTVTFTAKGDKTDVALNVKPGAAGVAQPAHIHDGQCPVPGAVKYPLKDVVDGKSTTTLDVTLAQLLTGTFAVNVHLSAADIGKYVACGGIAQGSVVKLDNGRDGNQPGTAVLVAQGAKTDVYMFIKPLAGVIQPAHIHEGQCPVPGAVKYPLTDLVDGKSKTTVDVALADLLKGGLAINAHLSKADIGKYVACGAIKSGTAALPSNVAAAPADDGYGYNYK